MTLWEKKLLKKMRKSQLKWFLLVKRLSVKKYGQAALKKEKITKGGPQEKWNRKLRIAGPT